MAMTLVACTADDDAARDSTPADATPLTFDTYLAQTPESRAIIDDIDALRAVGFGVYAYYTPNGDYAPTTEPNFMYNQHVEYKASFGAPYVTSWTYFPIKFWPNDYSTGAVDDQDDDTGNNPATGSRPDRLSFFAYAPYAEANADGTLTASSSTGITALSANSVNGDPLVSYTITSCRPDLADAPDILWGVDAATGLPHRNLTKQRTDETVAFAFRHALAKLRVYVCAVADEVAPGTGTIDGETRILINSISVSGNATSSAKLNLNNTVANTPIWQEAGSSAVKFKAPTAATINPVIYAHTPLYDRNGAAINMSDISSFLSHTPSYWDTGDNFSHLPAGVSTTPQSIFATDDYAYLFIPLSTASAPLTDLTFNVRYTVITRDPALVRNNPAGFSIVTNDINRTLSLSTPFQGGKEYAVRLLLGMTSVKFEATVNDWGSGDNTEVYIPQNQEKTP
jgi:hypothetical protein